MVLLCLVVLVMHTLTITCFKGCVYVSVCAARLQVSQLLLLDNQDATKDIKMFINSPGALQHLQAAWGSGVVVGAAHAGHGSSSWGTRHTMCCW